MRAKGKRTTFNEPQLQLAKGQIWRIDHGYVHIVERGKSLLHYTIMRKLSRRATRTQVSGIAEVEKYLKANGAKLLRKTARLG